MPGQSLVEKSMVRIEKRQNGSVILKRVREKPNRFLIHGTPQAGECRKVTFTLFIERFKIMNMQPGAGKLRREPPNPIVAQHAASLRGEHVRVTQRSFGRRLAQFGVRGR